MPFNELFPILVDSNSTNSTPSVSIPNKRRTIRETRVVDSVKVKFTLRDADQLAYWRVQGNVGAALPKPA